MRLSILALLGSTLVLAACAGQPSSATAEQALNRYGAKAQFQHFRPLQPDFRDEPAGEYRFVQARRYEGRGQVSHYRWKREPLE